MSDPSADAPSESAGGPLSDDELRTLSRLLARFAEHELDQFELWTVHKPGWGDVYIDVGLQMPQDGRGESAYTRIWPLPPRLTEG